jgi:hypothetical protein
MSNPALKLGPKGEVRWRAFSPDGRYSPSFKMWVQGEDVYFAQRSIKDMKVSLHTKTGDAHAAFNTHEASAAWTGKLGGSKWISDWNAAHEFTPGWREVGFSVLHPETELRPFIEQGIDKVNGLINLFVPADMALAMTVFKVEPVEQATSVTFSQAIHVATFAADGWDFHLMALLQPWTAEHREWARKARLVKPGTTDYSLAPPEGFNIDSPSARLLKLVSTTNGGKYYVDLAARE